MLDKTKQKHKPEAKQRQRALDTIRIMETLGEEVTEEALRLRAKVSKGTAGAAIAVREASRGAELSQRLADDRAIEAKLSPKSKMTLAKAIEIHKGRLNKKFWAVVDDEVRKRIAAADDAARKQNNQLRQERDQLAKLLRAGALFAADDYRTILACLHPGQLSLGRKAGPGLQSF